MHNDAAFRLHGGLIEPDPSKNPHKFEKMRERLAKLQTKISVHQRQTLLQVMRIVGGATMTIDLWSIQPGDLLAMMDVVPPNEQQAFLTENHGDALVALLRKMPAKKRQRVYDVMEKHQRERIEMAIPETTRGVRRDTKKPPYEDVVGTLWRRNSTLRRRWDYGSSDLHYMLYALEEHPEKVNTVDRRIAEMIEENRIMCELLKSKQTRLTQLGPSARKKDVNRLHLLRSSIEGSKKDAATALALDLSVKQKKINKNKRDTEAKKLVNRATARLQRAAKMARIHGKNGHVPTPSRNGVLHHDEPDEPEVDLYGGVEHVPA